MCVCECVRGGGGYIAKSLVILAANRGNGRHDRDQEKDSRELHTKQT